MNEIALLGVRGRQTPRDLFGDALRHIPLDAPPFGRVNLDRVTDGTRVYGWLHEIGQQDVLCGALRGNVIHETRTAARGADHAQPAEGERLERRDAERFIAAHAELQVGRTANIAEAHLHGHAHSAGGVLESELVHIDGANVSAAEIERVQQAVEFGFAFGQVGQTFAVGQRPVPLVLHSQDVFGRTPRQLGREHEEHGPLVATNEFFVEGFKDIQIAPKGLAPCEPGHMCEDPLRLPAEQSAAVFEHKGFAGRLVLQ